MGSCGGVRRQLLSLLLVSLLAIPLFPLVGSDPPPGTPYYVYGFVKDESGPVVGAVVNLTLSTGGTVVAWNETTTDANGLYIALFHSATIGDMVTGRTSGVTNNLLVSGGPGGWLNFTYTHLEYTLSPGWNLISMGLLTNTLASEITSQTSTCLFIVNWSASAKAYTQTYARGSSEGDFSLVDGYGYWAYATETETFNITGIEKTGPKTYTLAPGGWNLVGWTDNTTTTASTLCSIVNDTYYGGVRGYITPWNTSIQEYDDGYLESPLFPSGSIADIPITRQHGYWIWISTAANWTADPSLVEAWSGDILLTDPADIYRYSMIDVSAWDDYVHVVCVMRFGSAPFITYRLQYMRSTDGGASWSNLVNLSIFETILLPKIASWENHVYVTWTDNRGGDKPEIYMTISHDYGATWTGDFNISANNAHTADWSRVTTEENRVVVVWGDQRHSAAYPTIYMRTSLDYGATWGEEKLLTDLALVAEGSYEIPAHIILRGQNISLLLERGVAATGRVETSFMKSTDFGQTWTTPTMLSQLDGWNSYPNSMAIDGDKISVVWENASAEDEQYLRRSLDGGTTWLPEQRLTNDPAASVGGLLTYRNSDELFMVFGDTRSGTGQIWVMKSSDHGETWTSEEQIIYEGYGGKAVTTHQNIIHMIFTSQRTGVSELYYKRYPALP